MNLALFFTFGISAQLWKAMGLLDREKLIYERMAGSETVNKVFWFTYGTDDKAIENDLHGNIEIVPMPQVFNSRIGMYLYSLLLPFVHGRILRGVNILKTNQMSGSWTAVIAKILYRKALIVRTGFTWSLFFQNENTGTFKKHIICLIERMAYLFSDGIIVSSGNDMNYIKEKYTLKGMCKIISNYVETDIFRPGHKGKIPDSICFVGRLIEQKNLFSLLKSLVGTPYMLNIVGSGEQREALMKFAAENGINVKFTDNIPNHNIPELLNVHEVFVLPSFYEGTPKVLLEAMACGLPCIGADVHGINDIISHNENGVLCSTDPESIRKALFTVFNDESLRNRLSQNARKTITENFSIDKYLEKELSLYKGLISSQRSV